MDETIGWVALVSFSITFILSPFLFWLIWLRNGHYEMPAVLKEMDKKKATIANSSAVTQISSEAPIVQKDPMERNLFKFTKKMIHYLFFMDQSILMRDIGFEQTLYIIFIRRVVVFKFVAGVIVSLFVFVWARLRTSDTTLILKRLIGSKDLTLIDLDVNTFILCCYTIVFTMFLLRLRKYMASRLIRSVIDSEERKSEHQADIFYQIRTIKFRGLSDKDKKAKVFKMILEGYMKVNKVKGELIKVIVLPFLEERIKLEKEREGIENG